MGGGAPKPIRKIVKPIKKVVKPIKKIVRPVKKIADEAFEEVIEKPAKKIVKPVKKIADEVFEEVIEKPAKKIVRETVDTLTGMDKYDRRPPPVATEPEVTPEVTPEVVPDDTVLGRGPRRTKGKRAGGAGTLMEGYGVTYSKPSSKSPTGGSA